MRIAQVLPVMTATPPPKYGGIQRVTYELILKQAAAGHQVTVFAAGGSTVFGENITLIESSPYPTAGKGEENRTCEIRQILDVIAKQHEFDVINLHYEPITLRVTIDGREINLLEYFEVPTITTFHNLTYLDKHIEYYGSHPGLWDKPMAFLSESHRAPLPFFKDTRILYNGLPIDEFPFGEKSEDYLLFLGRITPVKGLPEAIQVARAVGKKLIIAAKVDAVDKDYYEKEVAHLIDGEQIEFIGEVGFEEKVALYAKAYCTLFPIKWPEPFGSVMIESMACGAPVLAFRQGSVPEVIEDGKTGFIVDTVEEMIDAVGKVESLSRKECRKHVEERFTIDRLAADYEEVFKELTTKK